MKRTLVLVLCCCALAAGCGETSNAPAATVDGVTVTTKDVVDELDAISANPAYLESIDSQFKQGGQTVVGASPGTYDADFVGQVLARQMQFAVTHEEVARRDLTASEECKVAAKSDLMKNLGGGDAEKGEETFAGFPEEYRNRLEGWYTDEWVLQSDLVQQPCGDPDVAKAYFDAHPEEFEQVCFSLIEVGDQSTADAVVAQGRAGGDFASLAQQVSTHAETASSGGDAGCHYPTEIAAPFVPTLQATATGAVSDPVPSNQGRFVVFKVNDRNPAVFADVSSDAEQLATRDQAVEFRAWLQHTFEDAQITVDPRYGTFDMSTFTVKPPASEDSSSPSGSEGPPASTP